jgi:hypothetical protein
MSDTNQPVPPVPPAPPQQARPAPATRQRARIKKKAVTHRNAPQTLVPSVDAQFAAMAHAEPERVPLVAAKPAPPPTSPGGRHVLRSADEYPADEMQGGMHHIPRADYPQGFDLQWVGVSVWGQPLNFVIADFASKGWVSVYPEDFDGQFANRVPAGWNGPIVVQELMLVARSMAWSDKARALAKRDAQAQVNVKVNQLRQGELERVTLSPQHKHLAQTNYINSSIEGVRVPNIVESAAED